MTKLLQEKQPVEKKMSKALEVYHLTDQQKEAIEKSQQSLLDKPVDIVKLAKNLGIAKVVRSDLGEKISGMIEKRKEGFVIITNEAEPKVRRRFTIAHELAHFLLHKDQISDGITENTLYRGGLSNRCEVEANRLAADILMPLGKIEEYINREGTAHVSLKGMADNFEVSISAMTVRLGIPSNLY